MDKPLDERLRYLEDRCKKEAERADWYKQELAKTQEILGRVLVQYSERWDKVMLTNHPRTRPTK